MRLRRFTFAEEEPAQGRDAPCISEQEARTLRKTDG
jgi:hypothetical protein